MITVVLAIILSASPAPVSDYPAVEVVVDANSVNNQHLGPGCWMNSDDCVSHARAVKSLQLANTQCGAELDKVNAQSPQFVGWGLVIGGFTVGLAVPIIAYLFLHK